MEKRDFMKDLKIIEIIAKATPGPWEVTNGTDVFTKQGAVNAEGVTADENDGWQIADCGAGATYANGELTELSAEEQQANARFIAAARSGWPEAIHRAIEAEKEVERLREEIQHHIDLMMSAAELMTDDIDPEQRGKSSAYLIVVKALREILDGKIDY